MNKKGILGWVAEILVVIGALNWGLVGAFRFDLVSKIFGIGTLARVVYILVGVAALYVVIFVWFSSKSQKPKAA